MISAVERLFGFIKALRLHTIVASPSNFHSRPKINSYRVLKIEMDFFFHIQRHLVIERKAEAEGLKSQV